MEILTDYTLRTVALGALLLGAVSGALGTFAVLRRQSLLGDAISHAALPGIAIAFLVTGSKLPLVLMIGAALTGWLATLLVMQVTRNTRIKYDSALALMLSVFFGIGLVLLTMLQKMPYANQAGLDSFLFGQASSLVERDVVTMAFLGGVTLLATGIFWKEFKLLSFDTDFGTSLGLPMQRLDITLTTLLVIAIVIGLQTVGVVLMSAMIIAAPAAARQWTDRLGVMVLLAMAFGAVSGVLGALFSAGTSKLPTGPTIVLCVTAIVIVSMVGAPKRGLLWRTVRKHRSGRRLRLSAVLMDLYALAGQHEEREHPHALAAIEAMHPRTAQVRHKLLALAERGFVVQTGTAEWALTPAGIREAEHLLKVGADEETE